MDTCNFNQLSGVSMTEKLVSKFPGFFRTRGNPDQQLSEVNSYTYRGEEVNGFLSFGFNTKIQRYHTSPSQISSFTLEPKLEEKGEEKRLVGGGDRKSKTNSRCSFIYSPCNIYTSVTSGNRLGC